MKPTTKIEALNSLNKNMPVIAGKIQTILRPYIGKKVTTQNGWIAKIAPEIKKACEAEGFRCFLLCGTSCVYLEMDCTIPFGEFSVEYVKQSGLICILDGHTLKEIRPLRELRTDYTQQEIDSKHAEIQELMKRIHVLESEIPAQLLQQRY